MPKLYNGFATATIWTLAADLANGARKAALYDNSTNLAPFGHFFLNVLFDTTAPAAGTKIAELYILPEDGSAGYPEGGDGTVGEDDTPQGSLLVGSVVTINPSTSVVEQLCFLWVPLSPKFNVVLVNTSGQAMEGSGATKTSLTLKPLKLQAD